MLPKATRRNLPAYLELLAGQPSFWIMPTLETAEVFDAREMRALRRLLCAEDIRARTLSLRIGGNDLLHLLGVRRSCRRTIYDTAVGPWLSMLACTFRPYGFNLTAPVFEGFEHPDVLREEVERDLEHGLFGKTAVHPDQVELIEAMYAVSAEDLATAESLLGGSSRGFPYVWRDVREGNTRHLGTADPGARRRLRSDGPSSAQGRLGGWCAMKAQDRRRVWFNQGLSCVDDALTVIREADRPAQLTLLASHSLTISPVHVAAEESWIEPAGSLSDDEYVDWCLQNCAAREVHLFVPGRGRRAVACRRSEFESKGTRILVAARPEVLDLLQRKDRLYADLAGEPILLPAHRTVRTGEELDEAYRALSEQHTRLCIKPARSIFGAGFHVLEDEDDEYERLVSLDSSRVGAQAFRRAMAGTQRLRDLLLMEYLPGPERSVDCLAEEGRLLAAVARVKREGRQELETSGAAIDLAAVLTRRYCLNGIFNVQTRDARGAPHLLKINPAMSGGILYACLSGLVLPYWAVVLALGLRRSQEVPVPRSGLVVAPVSAAVIVQARNRSSVLGGVG